MAAWSNYRSDEGWSKCTENLHRRRHGSTGRERQAARRSRGALQPLFYGGGGIQHHLFAELLKYWLMHAIRGDYMPEQCLLWCSPCRGSSCAGFSLPPLYWFPQASALFHRQLKTATSSHPRTRSGGFPGKDSPETQTEAAQLTHSQK